MLNNFMKSIISLIFFVIITSVTSITLIDVKCGETANLSLDTCHLEIKIFDHSEIRNLKLSKGVKSSKNVTKVVIEDQTMLFMPSNLSDYFSHIEELKILKSQLREIEKVDIENFRELKIFHIIGNEIEEIKGDLFENNVNLVEIDLSENKIKSIAENTFEILLKLKLKTLNLNDNRCISKGSLSSNLLATLALIKKCDFTNLIKFEFKDFKLEIFELREKYRELDETNNLTLTLLHENEIKLTSEIEQKTLLITLIMVIAFSILFIFIFVLTCNKRKSYKFRVADEKNSSRNQMHEDFEFKEVEEVKVNNQMREAEEFIRIQESNRDVE